MSQVFYSIIFPSVDSQLNFSLQVVSVCQGGTVVVWMVDTGQKVKSFANTHGQSEVTALAQDLSETRLFTGSTDGTIKVNTSRCS